MKHVVLSNGMEFFDCEVVDARLAQERVNESGGFYVKCRILNPGETCPMCRRQA